MQNMREQVDPINNLKDKWLMATVVNNVDPGNGARVQITCAAIPSIASTPVWAAPDTVDGGNGGGDETQDIPAIGSEVYVKFQNGDIHFPLYRGAVIKPGGLPTLGGDPNIYGRKRGVVILKENKTTGDIVITCPNFTVHVDENGNATITGGGTLTLNFQSSTLNIPNNTINGNVTVNGNMLIEKNLTVEQETAVNGGFTAADGVGCTLPADTTIAGKQVDGHIHGNVQNGGGVTNPF